MAETFGRWLGPVSTLPTGMFTVNTEGNRPALSCPVCGTINVLPAGFGPDQSGRTRYRVRCESTHCHWWDYAVLESIWLEVLT